MCTTQCSFSSLRCTPHIALFISQRCTPHIALFISLRCTPHSALFLSLKVLHTVLFFYLWVVLHTCVEYIFEKYTTQCSFSIFEMYTKQSTVFLHLEIEHQHCAGVYLWTIPNTELYFYLKDVLRALCLVHLWDRNTVHCVEYFQR